MNKDVTSQPAFKTKDVMPSSGHVHIIGAGPVGLFLTALLQPIEGYSITLYEKRKTYSRTRMVKLASYLTADSIESYCADNIDKENIGAIFDQEELLDAIAFRQAIPSDLMSLLQEWIQGFCPLKSIEESLSQLIDARKSNPVERIETNLKAEAAMDLIEPGDILIDCSGCKSLFRDHLAFGPDSGIMDANTYNLKLEYAVIITFVYSQAYSCNEYCKYYKNAENMSYKFIPAVDRTSYDGNISYVSGIVNITPEDYEAMPPKFDGEYLRAHFPDVARSMDRFIDKIKQETNGEIVGDLEVVRIPLNLYRARNNTNRHWIANGANGHPFTNSPVFLVGDSAVGSPYFQSISLGFESAMYLAGLMTQRDQPLSEIFQQYEQYMYKQWLRVYTRSKLIKHNKDLFEAIDDPFKLLELLHIY